VFDNAHLNYFPDISESFYIPYNHFTSFLHLSPYLLKATPFYHTHLHSQLQSWNSTWLCPQFPKLTLSPPFFPTLSSTPLHHTLLCFFYSPSSFHTLLLFNFLLVSLYFFTIPYSFQTLNFPPPLDTLPALPFKAWHVITQSDILGLGEIDQWRWWNLTMCQATSHYVTPRLAAVPVKAGQVLLHIDRIWHDLKCCGLAINLSWPGKTISQLLNKIYKILLVTFWQ